MLTEAELIRQWLPPYNLRLRDDKSPLYIVITDEDFPRVITTRRSQLPKWIKASIFGPFQSGYMVKQVLGSLRPIFRWCNQAARRGTGRPCFFYHIERCSGACCGEVEAKQYRKDMRRLAKVLRGEIKSVRRQFVRSMQLASQSHQYEKAAKIRNQILALDVITTQALSPDITLPNLDEKNPGGSAVQELAQQLQKTITLSPRWLPRRIEAYDVSNYGTKAATVAMVVFIDGQPASSFYRLFNIPRPKHPDDYGMLKIALQRRQNHEEWGIPQLVLIDGGKGQVAAVKEVWQWSAPVIGIAKDPDRIIVNTKSIPADHWGDGGKLLQQLRDEAHRFGKKQSHKMLTKEWLSP